MRLGLLSGGPSFATGTLGEILAAALGLLAAGVRLLPSPALAGQPLFGRRELLALALLLVGALCGPGILAAPFLILLADLAFAPASLGLVLRRTGIALGRAPGRGERVRCCSPRCYSTGLDAWQLGPRAWFRSALLVPGAPLLDALRRHRLAGRGVRSSCCSSATGSARPFRTPWRSRSSCAALVRGVLAARRPLISLFGVALLVPTVLWRIAIAVTAPRGAEVAAEQPLPSVPALRDLIRRMRAEPRPAAAPAAVAPVAAPAPTRSECGRRSNARSRERSRRRSSRSASRSAARTRPSRPAPPSRSSGTGS